MFLLDPDWGETMRRKKSVHIHKYHKEFLGKKKTVIWKCAFPDCTHFVYTGLVLGKQSVCWNCGDIFILPKIESKLISEPWCEECSVERKKAPEDLSDLEQLLRSAVDEKEPLKEWIPRSGK